MESTPDRRQGAPMTNYGVNYGRDGVNYGRGSFSPDELLNCLIDMVGRNGFEPSTSGLKVRCSTD